MKKRRLFYCISGILGLFSCNQKEISIEKNENLQNVDSLSSRSNYYIFYSISDLTDICYEGAVPYLECIMDQIFEDGRSYYQLYDEFVNIRREKMNSIYIDNQIDAYAEYDPMYRCMIFLHESYIGMAFPEEFLHFIQGIIYEGRGYIISEGWQADLEFEAKLVRDIFDVDLYGYHYHYGMGAEHPATYGEWVHSIHGAGAISIEEILEGYNGLSYYDFLEDYAVLDGYTGMIGGSHPELLTHIYEY